MLPDDGIDDVWNDSEYFVETLAVDEAAKKSSLTQGGDVFGDLNYMYHPQVQEDAQQSTKPAVKPVRTKKKKKIVKKKEASS